MARTPIYSPSPQRQVPAERGAGLADAADAAAAADAADAPGSTAKVGLPWLESAPVDTKLVARRGPLPAWSSRHRQGLWAVLLLALVLLAGWPGWTAKAVRPLTLAQIDSAMREAIARQPLDSAGVGAYAAILPSVVRVEGEADPDAKPGRAGSGVAGKSKPSEANPRGGKAGGKPGPQTAPDESHGESGHSVGTGVVIVDKGLILTSLHVVDGAQRISVTFADGSRSAASVVNRQPENDLAVLQAHTLPDDLQAATLRSTAGLSPGEAVLAVGYPFGIGPSASLGVVSGLQREFRTPDGQRILTNLIQFDAAANPGNSGGPLVTMDGHVVGIVAAIMNPNHQRTFIGIGFAVPIENAAAAVGMPPF